MNYLIVILNGLIFVFIIHSEIFSQNHKTVVNLNGWYMYFGNYSLTPKISLNSEYQWRRNEIIKNWQQSLTRIGLTYSPYPEWSFTMGYGHILTYPYGKMPVLKTFLENRLWEQILLTHNLKNWKFKHRYRLEQRWLENITSSSPKWIFYHRMRYQFWWDIVLYSKNHHQLLFSFYDEVFINFGKNVQKNFLDQNRLYFAFGWVLQPNLVLRWGYLNQRILKPNSIQMENNHTLQFSINQAIVKKSKSHE